MYIHKPRRIISKGNNSHRNGPSSLLFIIIICPVDMNVYVRFDEIPSITLKDIKKTKRYGRTDGWTDNVKTVYPPTNTVCGGYVDMNVYVRFDEIPSITLKDIKKTKRYGRTDARTDGWTDNVKTVYPPTNTVCGGYNEYTISQMDLYFSVLVM